MDDAETPPDPENGKGDQTRRASLKLRDAEAVAATRRDMFGDGSLVDVLAGNREGEPSPVEAPPADPADALAPPSSDLQPEDEEGQETQAETGSETQSQDAPQNEAPQEVQFQDAQPLEPLAQEAPAALPADDGSAGNDDRAQDDRAPAEPDGPHAVSTTDSPESLDDIIDSFPAEPPAAEGGETEPPGFNLPPLFPEHGLEGGGLRGGQAPVSAIFNTLDTVREPAEEPPDPAALAPEPPSADMPGNDASAPDHTEPDESRTADTTVGEDSGQDASMHEAGEAASQPADPPADPDVPQLSEPSPAAGDAGPAWPPFPEPPGSSAAPSEPAVMPPLIELPTGDPGLAPFSSPSSAATGATPEWPPLPEPPGAGTEPPSAPGSSGMPPYIELPAEPAETSHTQAQSPPDYPLLPEHPAAPHSDAPDVPHFPDPDPAGHMPEGHGPALDETTDASAEATAKIAAEATATAQALDSLQRLLDQSIPDTVPTQRPVRSDTTQGRRVQSHGPSSSEWTAPRASRSPARRRASDRPLRLPPDDTGPGAGVYLLGFLTGVGLSLMAGLALYFLISTS